MPSKVSDTKTPLIEEGEGLPLPLETPAMVELVRVWAREVGGEVAVRRMDTNAIVLLPIEHWPDGSHPIAPPASFSLSKSIVDSLKS